jgi:hypothetical protein
MRNDRPGPARPPDATAPPPSAGSGRPPQVYCVTDPEARVAAVLERRPRQWWRVGRWDLAAGTYEPGAWFRGSLYPQRCDLSPGGRWLAYFARTNYETDWPAGQEFNAVSRLPWLTALAAWREYGTWSRGHHFVPEVGAWEVGEPTVGDATACRAACGMQVTVPAHFATERRRGWRESDSTPRRDPEDVWDERREVEMVKPSPAVPPFVLSVRGRFAAFRSADLWVPDSAAYALSRGGDGDTETLWGAQWVDWTSAGLLAVVTRDGAL